MKYQGFATAVKACALVAYAIGWYKVRHMNTPMMEDIEKKVEEKDLELVVPLKTSDENDNE